MYLDASAIKTVLLKEPGWTNVALRIEDHRTKLITSPISVFEAVIDIAGSDASSDDIETARQIVRDFLNEAGAREVVISDAQTKRALELYARQSEARSETRLELNEAFILGIAKSLRSKIICTNERFPDQ